MVNLKELKIGVVPGTGNMGFGLAGHLIDAGLSVAVGSRDAEKGKKIAAELTKTHPHHVVTGGSNDDVASQSDVIIWTVAGPLEDREALLKSLAPHLKHKIIIDVTNIGYLISESEWGQTSSTLLNEKWLVVPAKWTTAFKATFASLLEKLPDPSNPFTQLVVGDDEEAVKTTIAIVDSIPGFKGINAGRLRNSKIVELLGPKFVSELNREIHGSQRTGWRFGP